MCNSDAMEILWGASGILAEFIDQMTGLFSGTKTVTKFSGTKTATKCRQDVRGLSLVKLGAGRGESLLPNFMTPASSGYWAKLWTRYCNAFGCNVSVADFDFTGDSIITVTGGPVDDSSHYMRRSSHSALRSLGLRSCIKVY